MFDVFTSINWIGVLLAFLAYFFLGALWYMLLFSKSYRVSLGRDPNIKTSQSPLYIIGPAVCSLIITITCAILIAALKMSSYTEAIQFILIVSIGYLFTNTVNIAINPNIPRPFLYGVITGTYHIAGMISVNTILFAML